MAALVLLSSSSIDSVSDNASADCIPIIAALSLHSARAKSQNALSSRFFDASNNR